MKHLIPRRRWAALLIVGATAASLATTAVAGNAYGHRRTRSAAPRISASFSWQSGGLRPVAFGRFAVRDRGDSPRPVRDEACAVDHQPHVWYDGRLWCSGKNADGSWRGPWHCEDDWGRKKVNLPGFDGSCEKWVNPYPR
jgi:hypothetical protein